MESTNKYGLAPIVIEKDCTGCSACMNVCPKSAIIMEENVVGHILPFIDKDKCIDCNACRKVCPSIHPVVKNHPQATYAAWAKEEIEHVTSTSGGIAAVISRTIIRKGGVVYGCASLKGGVIKHIRITEENDIALLKGSKYVQSDINDILKRIKEDLISGKHVAFFGTPCQTAGLRSFLKKNYENLLVVDLICHGVPSQRLLFEHLQAKGIERKNIDKVEFREKEKYCLKVTVNGEMVYKKDDLHDLYLSGFNDCLFDRESCVNCKYATNERVGDITIGDFRRLGVDTPFKEPNRGSISVVLSNTQKGRELLKGCSGLLTMHPREFKEANVGNPHLHQSSFRKGDYPKFLSIYEKSGFRKAARITLRVRIIKNTLLLIFKKLHRC